LAKYDSAGNEIWVKYSKANLTTTSVYGHSVAIDLQENVFVTGYFPPDTIMFGTDTLKFSGNTDTQNVFIVKYDSSGNVIWARNGYGNGYCVIADSLGNSYISGGMSYNDTLNIFDTLTIQLSGWSVEPMFIVKFNSAGDALYGLAMDGGGDDYNALAKGPFGSIYTGGDLMNLSNPPFIWGNDTLVLSGAETPFVAKLGFIGAGIPQISPQPTISLYPNPFSTTATLLIRNYELGIRNGEVQIIDLMGREVKTIPIINQKEITINRDNLADGMYFYKIIGNKNETEAVGKMVIE
jgi:hypothetical protein